jgi:hypothetical protein
MIHIVKTQGAKHLADPFSVRGLGKIVLFMAGMVLFGQVFSAVFDNGISPRKNIEIGLGMSIIYVAIGIWARSKGYPLPEEEGGDDQH